MNSKWLEFLLLTRKAKTSVWIVLNLRSKCQLGLIRWYPQWRQYVFIPDNETIFSQSCLRDIADFIKKQMNKRKK